MTRKKLFSLTLACLVAFGAIAYATRAWCLTTLAEMLIVRDPLVKADVIVVPSLEFLSDEPQALLHAARLAQQGYAPKILVDEGVPFYGRTACDFWVPFILERTSLDRNSFECVSTHSIDVRERLRSIGAVLRTQGVRRALVVTPELSTRRYRGMLRNATPNIDFVVSGLPAQHSAPESWWQSREGRKALFFEVASTVLPGGFEH